MESSSSELFSDIKFVISQCHSADEVKNLLIEGGAKHINYLSEHVTLVIADVNCPEVEEAVELFDKPVVSSVWVHLSVTAKKMLPFEAFSPIRRIFHNVIASFSSDLSINDIDKLAATLTFYGAQVSRDASCATHFIVPSSTSSDLISKTSLNSNLKTVAPDWVLDSLRMKCICEERLYDPKFLLPPKPPTPSPCPSPKVAKVKVLSPEFSVAPDVPDIKDEKETLKECPANQAQPQLQSTQQSVQCKQPAQQLPSPNQQSQPQLSAQFQVQHNLTQKQEQQQLQLQRQLQPLPQNQARNQFQSPPQTHSQSITQGSFQTQTQVQFQPQYQPQQQSQSGFPTQQQSQAQYTNQPQSQYPAQPKPFLTQAFAQAQSPQYQSSNQIQPQYQAIPQQTQNHPISQQIVPQSHNLSQPHSLPRSQNQMNVQPRAQLQPQPQLIVNRVRQVRSVYNPQQEFSKVGGNKMSNAPGSPMQAPPNRNTTSTRQSSQQIQQQFSGQPQYQQQFQPHSQYQQPFQTNQQYQQQFQQQQYSSQFQPHFPAQHGSTQQPEPQPQSQLQLQRHQPQSQFQSPPQSHSQMPSQSQFQIPSQFQNQTQFQSQSQYQQQPQYLAQPQNQSPFLPQSQSPAQYQSLTQSPAQMHSPSLYSAVPSQIQNHSISQQIVPQSHNLPQQQSLPRPQNQMNVQPRAQLQSQPQLNVNQVRPVRATFNSNQESPRILAQKVVNSSGSPMQAPSVRNATSIRQTSQSLVLDTIQESNLAKIRSKIPAIKDDIEYVGYGLKENISKDSPLLGCRFKLIDYNDVLPQVKTRWIDSIKSAGGSFEDNIEIVTHLICEDRFSTLYNEALKLNVRCVTIYWVHDVLTENSLTYPWKALHLPLPFSKNDRPLKDQIVSATNFKSRELRQVKEMVLKTGATFTDYFSSSNTLLICGNAGGDKYDRAIEWRVPLANSLILTDFLLSEKSDLSAMLSETKYQLFSLKDPLRLYSYLRVRDVMKPWQKSLSVNDMKKSVAYGNPHNLIETVIPKNEAIKLLEDSIAIDSNQSVSQGKLAFINKENIKDVCGVTNNDDMTKAKGKVEVNEIDTTKVVEANNSLIMKKKRIANDPIHVLLTHLDSNLMKQLDTFARKLGLMLTNRPSECTHLVVDRISRTPKFVCAFSRASYILSHKWIIDSYEINEVLDEQHYILEDKKGEEIYSFNLVYSLMKRKKREKLLFCNMVFFVTPSVIARIPSLKEMIASAGGCVATRKLPSRLQLIQLKSDGKRFVVITCEEDINLFTNFDSSNVDMVGFEFVISGILRQDIDFESHRLKLLTEKFVRPVTTLLATPSHQSPTKKLCLNDSPC